MKAILASKALSTRHVPVLTARTEEKGSSAIDALEKEGLEKPLFHTLDITDEASVAKFSEWVSDLGQPIHALLNNAGFAYKGSTFGASEAAATLDVNLHGTRRVTDALLPLIKKTKGSRIVNVCSQAGKLDQISSELQSRVTADDFTQAHAIALGQQYVDSIRQGKHEASGWSNSMYGVSKLLEIAYSRALARDLKWESAKEDASKSKSASAAASSGPDAPASSFDTPPVAVHTVCPGWCSTSMSSHKGHRSAAKGAETPVWLATAPEEELAKAGGPPTAGFWHDQKPIEW